MAGRVLIVGAGAIGGTLGALLARAGSDVVFLVKSPETAAKIAEHGLTVRGVRGTFTVRPRVESEPGRLRGPFRAAMAAVKAYDLAGALRPVLPALSAECPVVSLQNGLCVDELEGLAGPDRSVGCVVGWGATMHGSAEMELTSEGEMVVGCRSASGRVQVETVRELLSSVFPTSISGDIYADLYSKLIINSCITTLGALSGKTLGWMLGRRLYRRVFIGIIREAMMAARAAGIIVPPYAGRLDYYAFLKGEGPVGALRRHLVLLLMGAKYRRLKSSSLQSLERGRLTEVDYFNGSIARIGRDRGVATPLNERLTLMVHEIENRTRAIGPRNVTGSMGGGTMDTPAILKTLRRQASEMRLLDQAHGHAVQYIAGMRAMRAVPDAEARQGLASLPTVLPDEPMDPSRILDMLHRFGSPATVPYMGGRYFGFVNGGALPAALAARWLADAWDQNAAMHVMSPVSSALEASCEEWLVSLLGLPADTAAGFVGGTSVATMCGLAAGRDELLRRAGWDCGARGLSGAPEIRVVLGDQAHASVYKALGLLGLGRDRVERVPADNQGRIVAARLPRVDARTLLILQAGNVNTGAFDPFMDIIPAARDAGAWVHVDGAFGLWAAASPKLRRLTNGAEHADSWSADAHKTLNAPYDNGLVFCRSRESLAAAMRSSGAYFVFSTERDGMLYAPDMSRRARAVDVWASLLSLGRSGAAALVEELCSLAELFARRLAQEGFHIQNEVVFNQVLVTCGDPSLTTATLQNVQASGECWCGGTTWNGEPAIRISVCSFATTEEDVERSVRAFVAARR